MSDRDSLERGLAEAFGNGATQPASSVLRALQARCDSVLGVHLDAPDDTPASVTDEAKALRDPPGRYQVLGEIGRGGVGVVYKGRDTDLGRDVAMKVLKDEYADHPDVLARFVEEAQIGGQLQHPGIVPVYELGLQAGERPYFAMKLVKGETLAAQLARRDEPSEDRRRLLGVFEQVCQTIAYAHARHVVHRDLKPSNVMIGAFGEVQVVDWGFAKVLPRCGVADETRTNERSVIETVRSRPGSGSHSLPGSMLGTPAYMPPEQAQGDIARVDRRSDVFALGAILCEILTGEPPYREEGGDLVRQAAGAELDGAYARLKDCGADESLVKLCTECLARTQRARPESAAEVADRVSAYLTSVEERARRAEVEAAEARYRNRTTLVAAAAGLVLVLRGAGAWIRIDGQAQRRRAEASQRVATAMSAASSARGRAAAQAEGLDQTLWDAALQSARQAAEIARSDDVDAPTRAAVEALLADVERERDSAVTDAARRTRDARMLARLEELRIPIDEDLRQRDWMLEESRRLDAEYGAAFTEYLDGADVLALPAEESLALMRRGGLADELAASLDHWSLVRDGLRDTEEAPDIAGTARVREVAALLDPADSWRARLRELLPRAEEEGERLGVLADEADSAPPTAAGCLVLGEALWRAGKKDAAVEVLRRGQSVHPADFDLCFRLATSLERLDEPRWEEALVVYRIAHALRPMHGDVLHRQGMMLQKLGRYADAERVFRRLVDRDPSNPHWIRHVGATITEQGDPEAAIAVLEQALYIDPEDAHAHNALGSAFYSLGRIDDAGAQFRIALELDEGHAEARSNLGNVYWRLGELEEAVACHRHALEIEPKRALFLHNLGVVLATQKKYVEAIENLECAVGLEPNNAMFLHSLGRALSYHGDVEEAIAVMERACRIDPRNAEFQNTLGIAYAGVEKLAEAIECYGRVLDSDPSYAPTYINLGNAHEMRGELEEAARAFRKAAELFAREDSDRARQWGEYARNHVVQLEQHSTLERILTGLDMAPSSGAWSAAVGMGYTHRRFREIVALTEATLAESPELLGDESWHGYNSACAAALLAADPEKEPDHAERTRVRALARSWLAAEVDRWTDWLEAGERAADARERLRSALRDRDFASVRGDALETLPENERAEWAELWSVVEDILREERR